jgi:hypothetical protein
MRANFLFVRYQVLMLVSMEITLFWSVALWSLVKFASVSEVLAASIIGVITHCPVDGDTKHFYGNTGKLLPNYIA